MFLPGLTSHYKANSILLKSEVWLTDISRGLNRFTIRVIVEIVRCYTGVVPEIVF